MHCRAAILAASLAFAPYVHAADPPRSITALIAEQKARDGEAAAEMASQGQLLYDAEANKKSWGQYCADSQRLTDQGEFRSAIRAASKSLYLGQRDRNRSALAYAMRDLAYAYSFAGDLDRAAEWAGKALPAAREISNPNVNVDNQLVAPIEKILGDVAARRGNHAQALEHYQRALDAASLFSDQKVQIRVAIAAAELRAGRFDRARELLAKERSASGALGAIVRRGQGEIALAERKWSEADAAFRKSIEDAQSQKSAYAEMWGRYGLARALSGSGDREAAAAQIERAIDLAEGLRGGFRVTEFRSGFFGEVQSIFDFAVAHAAAVGNAARALRISEQARARAALDLVRDRARAGNQLAAVTRAADPATVAATLPERTALVAYHVLPDELLAWVVRRDGVALKRFPVGARDLQQAVDRLRRGVVTLGAPAPKELRELYAAILQPLELRPPEQVVFIPHRALHLAPLHALADGDGPLVRRHPVAYALSISAAAESLGRAAESRGGLLALGNPDLGDPQMDLPAAEDEVKAIARMSGSTAYVRADASAARFRANGPGAGIIHVAAHATVDEVDPLYSKLKLAAGDVEAREIYDMDLRSAGLVTLSACSSGMGRVAGGDEFLGFKRSFFVAGARTLLVSLWPVADESTARLMRSFYRHREGKGAAESLRLAQLELLDNPPDAAPLFWAPFILVGDWR